MFVFFVPLQEKFVAVKASEIIKKRVIFTLSLVLNLSMIIFLFVVLDIISCSSPTGTQQLEQASALSEISLLHPVQLIGTIVQLMCVFTFFFVS